MVRELKQSEITAFIDFGDRIYLNDPNYTPFMRGPLKKTIRKLVFADSSHSLKLSTILMHVGNLWLMPKKR